MSCASQALYTWLPRSPAAMLRCQKTGARTAAEIASRRSWCRRTNAKACAMTGARDSVCGMLSTISFLAALADFAWLCRVKKGASAGARVCGASLQTYHEKSWLEPLRRQSPRQRQRRPPEKQKQAAATLRSRTAGSHDESPCGRFTNSEAAAATSVDRRIGLAHNGNVAEARRVVI